MIIESAFTMLPELIAGLGFLRVKREANTVGAFSFSVLNALHSKNVKDPIQRLQLEKPFATKRAPLPDAGKNRHCDVFVDYGGSKIGSRRLANFGWRYWNYVECKFLKTYQLTKTGRSKTATSTSAEVIADLIRLVVLVPEQNVIVGEPNPKTSSARYFLVLSDNQPAKFINKYLGDLHSVFENPQKRSKIKLDLSVGRPSKSLAERVGLHFNRLKLIINQATCFSHYPIDPNQDESVWMLLLRIDSATIELDDDGITRWFQINADRSLSERVPGDYKRIRDFVSINIK